MNSLQEQTTPLYGKIADKFHELSANGAPPLARQSAFHKFQLLGFPTIKHEDWKYTNITRFLKEEYALEAPRLNAPAPILAQATIPGLDCYRIVLVNGTWNGEVVGGTLPKGFEILRTSDAAKDPEFAGFFTAEFAGSQHFAALNAALYTDGLFLHAAANAALDKPLHIIHIYTGDRNFWVQPRHVWVAGRNAELSIIESTLSAPGEPFIWINSFTGIFANPDAKLDHVNIQIASGNARLVGHISVHQKKQSLYNNYTFTLPGAALVRNDLQARLEEDHTETHLYGLYLTAGDQLVDNHTLVDHQRPHCFSNELYKGVLLGQSTGVFNGKVYVHRDAQKTNAFQQNNNLVISKKATIDSKPELEIFADDVKCSHGSTVGQFSEEALFYLRARGIGEAAAKALLINAFAFDVTDKLKSAAVAEYVNQQISHHIPVNHAG
jgi:Fe-S cluster assembly protein SufD